MTLAVDIPNTYFKNHPDAYSGGTGIGASAGKFISVLLPNIIIISGVVFFFLIVTGGFSLIMSAGQQKSPQEMAKAKATLTSGLIGFLLVVCSYFILQIIEAMLGVNLINPPSL